MTKKILMVLTGADTLTLADGSAHPTGYWVEEAAASHRVFRAAGIEVDIATPGGVTPTADPGSKDGQEELVAYLDGLGEALTKPLDLAAVSLADYDAIYLPGGHGPMTDLAADSHLGALLTQALAADKPIGALCHGLAGLLSAGEAFAGRRLTVFTDAEERQVLGERTPWWLESALRERGAVVEAGEPWSNNVVVDGNLVTGQNPQSTVDTAKAFATKLA
ncbi:type 1 glutamine amidotransferase domain-containing protein [Crossiella sp. SN42]|uniref:type 1 glutamine amidotransferase domain-containing protein n=1 Tax=Crossiella sp. SN42 TaxID=2944808 RepID=UPI00207CDDDF|nr:type 1 glutamine amidotransferase domain-containing protein [Crossiella sp. SN42]MCO1580851.1 type 1 glutamine amidotransferase domain-containing protein [Crossiella sp. SN42]